MVGSHVLLRLREGVLPAAGNDGVGMAEDAVTLPSGLAAV